ncbi:MAG: choice-of-anchor L domain-containing protein [Flavobacteriales bacterium]|nr:choice-of-anchor L domain-containing protein [Flavobacteriales bacterium]
MRCTLPLALFCPVLAAAQYVYDTSLPIAQMVQQVLAGPGVQVSNVLVTPGTTDQYAVFTAPNTCLQMAAGLLLTTGSPDIAGPNAALCWSTEAQPFGPSDPDMVTVLGGTTRDQVTLDLDVMPLGDSLYLEFRFGSEEFGPQVPVNDGMAIFLSGPGINGPYTNGAENLALLPGTADPVSTVHLLTTADSAYFVDNGDGQTAPFDTDPYYVQYDGLSVVLRMERAVQQGAIYHLRIAVADVFDRSCDSGVLLRAGGLRSPIHEGVAAVAAPPPGLFWDPQQEVLHLATTGGGWLVLHTVDGRPVRTLQVADPAGSGAALPGLPAGTYLVMFQSDRSAARALGRFVVVR